MVNQVNGLEELQKTLTEVAIGSTNSVKIQAVKNALNNEDIQVVPCLALSNVRPQPLSDEETLQGAINRAKDCLNKTESSYGIGLEAGVVFLKTRVYLCHWGALVRCSARIDRN